MILRRLEFLATVIVLAIAVPSLGWGQAPQPWSGKVYGYAAYIPDLNKPVRAALINNGVAWLSDADPDWLAIAKTYNCIQIDVPLLDSEPDDGAGKILGALNAASETFPDHPEIRHAGVVLFGFSDGSAAAARAASSPRLSNPDPALEPQRVLAVITLDEIDGPPYLPPLSTPHLFISSAGDRYSAFLTGVEDADPPITHDAFARRRATEEGAPLTAITQPGHWHGGSTYGFRNRIDYKFVRIWLDEVLKQRLPASPPQDEPALLPDWRNHAGWLGAYDVEINTATEPWGNAERMVNVAIGPREGFHDHRPYIWLPSRHAAEVWRTYAAAGTMPPLAPERPIEIVEAFLRQPGGEASGANDLPLTITPGPPRDPAAEQSRCVLGEDLELIVAFDRAVVAGQAAVSPGDVEIAAPPVFWSNRMRVKLSGAKGPETLELRLTNVAPADGGSPLEATLSAPCP